MFNWYVIIILQLIDTTYNIIDVWVSLFLNNRIDQGVPLDESDPEKIKKKEECVDEHLECIDEHLEYTECLHRY